MLSKVLSSILAVSALAVSTVKAAGLTQFTGNFGSNPTNAGFYYYKPNQVASNPSLIVAIHYCGGTAQAYYTGTGYHTLADQYGFIVIYPQTPESGGCWDVHTNATFTHNAGGDSLGIASMARYAISNWGVNAAKVYATGSSSGAMMTNVLMGAYPDVFVAGSAYGGVPYGCFGGSGAWNSDCAQGKIIKTPQQWGDLVRSGYPGYTGSRPKMLVWHGTIDTTLYPQNFWEEIKQWTNVLGYSQTPASNVTESGYPNYSVATYGPKFVAILAQNVGHTPPVQASYDLNWFGITGSGSSTTAPASTTPTTTPPSTSTPSSGSVAHWGQCGGQGYTGPTICQSPYTCTVSNQYYSQCL